MARKKKVRVIEAEGNSNRARVQALAKKAREEKDPEKKSKIKVKIKKIQTAIERKKFLDREGVKLPKEVEDTFLRGDAKIETPYRSIKVNFKKKKK